MCPDCRVELRCGSSCAEAEARSLRGEGGGKERWRGPFPWASRKRPRCTEALCWRPSSRPFPRIGAGRLRALGRWWAAGRARSLLDRRVAACRARTARAPVSPAGETKRGSPFGESTAPASRGASRRSRERRSRRAARRSAHGTRRIGWWLRRAYRVLADASDRT